MTESVYVHIDTTSNAVLTKGLTATDFANSIVHFPQNLLLLDPSASAGEYESHTGLKVIRGTKIFSVSFPLLVTGVDSMN